MRVHGHVPDLRDLYSRVRVSVAPLRWGAGVKGKVNTAHQLGVPVVCTSLAVDGMHAAHGEVLVALVPMPRLERRPRNGLNTSTCSKFDW